MGKLCDRVLTVTVLMVCPDYFVIIVGDVETDFAHTINVREAVPPIVKLF